MRRLVFVFFFLALFSALFSVTWHLELYDSHGDGWNGGTIYLYVNGMESIAQATLTSGYGPQTFDFPVQHGDRITTEYTPGGWPEENEYRVVNHDGETVLTSGAGYIAPTSITDPFMAAVLTSYPYLLGSGTNVGILPVNSQFDYSYSQSIYLNSDFPAPVLGYHRISKIKYFCFSAFPATHELQWDIHIGETTRTQFYSDTDWVPLSELTLVYSGNVHLMGGSGWVEITLDKPFDYDGSSNLVVAVDENTPLRDGGIMGFENTTVSPCRSLAKFTDGVNPDPADPSVGVNILYNPNIIFIMDPIIYPPHSVHFDDPATPLGWAQEYPTSYGCSLWKISDTSLAGGEPREIWADNYMSTCITTRLISPPVLTTGVSTLFVSFDHFFDDNDMDLLNVKLQYSHDMNTWTDTGWGFITDSGDVSGHVDVTIEGIAADFTFLAWTVEGDHEGFDNWYLDNIEFHIPGNDVFPLCANVPEVIDFETLVPGATIVNDGESPATFDVTLTFGDFYYRETQSVTDLIPGIEHVLEFPPFTPPWADEFMPVTVTVHNPGDILPQNDQLMQKCVCLHLDKQVYADVYNSSDPDVCGPSTFNLKTPGVVEHLGSPSAASQWYMVGADWLGNDWYAVEYPDINTNSSKFWQIDPTNGIQTFIGETGEMMQGIAWDPENHILYGTDGDNLYTLNRYTGAATLVGSHGSSSSFMSALAYDHCTDILYGVSVLSDYLYTIDTATGTSFEVGFLEIDIYLLHDLAFDRDRGYVFLTSYSEIFWIDTDTARLFKIGDFPENYAVQAFAIPYDAKIPEVTISPDGTLSWDPIDGVMEYNVFGSDDLYTGFTWLGSTPSTSWTDPAFPQERCFYRVTSIFTRFRE